MNVREATENGEVRLVSVKTQHQCADIFTKSLTKEKFKRFRDTIRGAVTYKDMVTEEINSSEQCAKAKEQKAKEKNQKNSKSINLVSIQTVIQENEELQSLQECIEGKASYAIPGYP